MATASTSSPTAASSIPAASVILLSGYGTVEMAMDAIRCGAFDFLTKPLIDAELEMAIDRALNQRRVHRREQDPQAAARHALRPRERRRPTTTA